MVAGQQMQKGAAPAFSDFPPITENYVPNEIGVVVNGARKQTVPEYLGFLSNQHQNESDLKKKGEIEGKMTSILKYFVSDQVEEASFHEYAAQCVNVLAESGLARKVLDPLLFDTVNEERLGMLYEMCIRVEAFREELSQGVQPETPTPEKTASLAVLLSSRRAATTDEEKMRLDLQIAGSYNQRLQLQLDAILENDSYVETKINRLAELYKKEQKLFASNGLANSKVALFMRRKIRLLAVYQMEVRLNFFNFSKENEKSIKAYLANVQKLPAWGMMGMQDEARVHAKNLAELTSRSISSKPPKNSKEKWDAIASMARLKSKLGKSKSILEAEPYVKVLWENSLKKSRSLRASVNPGTVGEEQKREPSVIHDSEQSSSKPSDKPAPKSVSLPVSSSITADGAAESGVRFKSDSKKYQSSKYAPIVESGLKNQDFSIRVMASLGAVESMRAFDDARDNPIEQRRILIDFIRAYDASEVFTCLRTEAALSDVGAFGDFASSVFSGQDEKAKTKLFGANGKGELSLEQLMARFSEMGIEARQDFLSKKGLLREFTKGHKFSLNGETSSINVSELGFELVSNQGGSMQSVAANMSNFNFTDSNGTIVQMPQEMKEGVALATMVHVMEYMRTAEYTTSDMIVRMEWSEPLKQPADIFVSEVVRSINERDFDALRKTLSESGFAVQAKARATQGWKPSDIENFASQVATEMPKDAGLAAIEKTVDELSEEIAEERSKA